MLKPLIALPSGFPQAVSPPQFNLGDRVQWRPCPTQDFGTVIGVQYAPVDAPQAWAWKYVIWLDAHSTSTAWAVSDTAWESDLEPLMAELRSPTPTASQHQP